MASTRPLPPIWLMGLGFLPLGAFGSIMLITVPQLLAAKHVAEPQIASITAIGLSPGFCSFLFAPLLDWRFSRRAYAVGFSVVGALCAAAALLVTRDLRLLTGLLFFGDMAICLNVAAVGGWFGNLVRTEDKGALGAWFTVANIGVGGLVASAAIYLLRDLPYVLGAGLLGRLASESFKEFARDVLVLLRRPTVLWTLPLFLAPSASFALTNILGGLGRDFDTPEAMVGLIGGAGVSIAGVLGSLVIPGLSKRIEPRPLYLLVGGVGAAFTLACILLPRSPATFGLAFLGENAFQASAFSVANLITLRTIGHENPLAATQFGLLTAAYALPLIYMQVIDGHAYGVAGVAGSYLADAFLSGGACAVLALVLWLFRRKTPAL
jgi:PAT family beta-lactamase induction signal transducer AmpG